MELEVDDGQDLRSKRMTENVRNNVRIVEAALAQTAGSSIAEEEEVKSESAVVAEEETDKEKKVSGSGSFGEIQVPFSTDSPASTPARLALLKNQSNNLRSAS